MIKFAVFAKLALNLTLALCMYQRPPMALLFIGYAVADCAAAWMALT